MLGPPGGLKRLIGVLGVGWRSPMSPTPSVDSKALSFSSLGSLIPDELRETPDRAKLVGIFALWPREKGGGQKRRGARKKGGGPV